jgi:hypothetical protein
VHVHLHHSRTSPVGCAWSFSSALDPDSRRASPSNHPTNHEVISKSHDSDPPVLTIPPTPGLAGKLSGNQRSGGFSGSVVDRVAAGTRAGQGVRWRRRERGPGTRPPRSVRVRLCRSERRKSSPDSREHGRTGSRWGTCFGVRDQGEVATGGLMGLEGSCLDRSPIVGRSRRWVEVR